MSSLGFLSLYIIPETYHTPAASKVFHMLCKYESLQVQLSTFLHSLLNPPTHINHQRGNSATYSLEIFRLIISLLL